MKERAVFALMAICLSPTFAWGHNMIPPKVFALDFLILGVAIGVGFRLLIEPLTEMSNEMGASVFLTLLFASIGVGLAVTHNPGWDFGEFAVLALVLAPLGLIYPENGLVRFFVMGPTCFIACVGVRMLYRFWVESGAEQVAQEVMRF